MASTVTVHALDAGHITIPERFFIVPSDPDAKHTVPSLSFLVQHKSPSTGKITRIVWDLGMRRDLNLYPEALRTHIESRRPVDTMPDAVTSLSRGGLTVDDIDYVMFSHVHYDHVGMPRDFTNPKTKFVVGNGALDLLSGKTKHDLGKHMVFEADLLPTGRAVELPPNDNSLADSPYEWTSLASFPHAIDFFHDGSVYILDAPGHLPGHMNLLCRISSNPTKYVCLAGDSCHDVRLLSGERDIATWTDETGRHCCIHVDIPKTKETLARLYSAAKDGIRIDGEPAKAQVEIVLAHDYAWEAAAKKAGKFFPGVLN